MTTEAETIRDLAQQALTAQLVPGPLGRSFLVTPTGTKVEEISDPHGLKTSVPRYIAQAVTVQTTQSLIEYVDRYKSPASVLFADIEANRIVAALDYHAPSEPANVAHRATLQLPFSVEWALWTEISGKLMPQLQFARFLEENGADVRAPDAADLLETVRDLQAHRKVNFIKAVRTSSDNENFEFSDETAMKGKRGEIEVPTKFKLGLPVYFGEMETEVFAFLRWKLDSEAGGLTLGIALHRAEHVRQAVFKQIVLEVSEATKCPAVFGKI